MRAFMILTSMCLSKLALEQRHTYSQIVGNESPTKALDRYSVYISLATPSR